MPDRPLSGRRAQAAANDETILRAAREVFVADPNAPVAAVAERAGVGISALYRRYPSKDALIGTLCALGQDVYLEEVERALAQDGDAWTVWADWLRRLVRADTHALVVRLAGTFTPTPAHLERAERMLTLGTRLFERTRDTGALRPGLTFVDIGFLLEMVASLQLGDERRTVEAPHALPRRAPRGHVGDERAGAAGYAADLGGADGTLVVPSPDTKPVPAGRVSGPRRTTGCRSGRGAGLPRRVVPSQPGAHEPTPDGHRGSAPRATVLDHDRDGDARLTRGREAHEPAVGALAGRQLRGAALARRADARHLGTTRVGPRELAFHRPDHRVPDGRGHPRRHHPPECLRSRADPPAVLRHQTIHEAGRHEHAVVGDGRRDERHVQGRHEHLSLPEGGAREPPRRTRSRPTGPRRR